MLELTSEEARVLGSLVEKSLATPQYYPLTMNALVNACNQSNNRDPVVAFDAATVNAALDRLRNKGVARVIHAGGGNRTDKYRHVLDEALGLDGRELALLTVLLLRGPQTLKELRSRTERISRTGGAKPSRSARRRIERIGARPEPPARHSTGRSAPLGRWKVPYGPWSRSGPPSRSGACSQPLA